MTQLEIAQQVLDIGRPGKIATSVILQEVNGEKQAVIFYDDVSVRVYGKMAHDLWKADKPAVHVPGTGVAKKCKCGNYNSPERTHCTKCRKQLP